MMITNRRIGRFYLDPYYINVHPVAVSALMKDLVILRAEFLAWTERIEYHAISPKFKELSLGEQLTTYVPQFETNNKAVTFVGWKQEE